MVGTQTAPVVVGVTRPGGLFPKDQAGGGGHTVQSVRRVGRPLVAPCHMGPGAGGGRRKLCTCPENPLGVKPREQRGACSCRQRDSSRSNENEGSYNSFKFCCCTSSSRGPVSLGFSAISGRILGCSPITWHCC